ncbi:MAG: hypothetical protein ACOVNU_04320 [Candidatus Kapaibacteriota bacterium]|jgi:hypothetical protein
MLRSNVFNTIVFSIVSDCIFQRFKKNLENTKGDNYEITVESNIPLNFSDLLNLSIINSKDGICILKGLIRDQSELHGIFTKLRDLNLKILSVKLLEE